jgi:hypothetical protein
MLRRILNQSIGWMLNESRCSIGYDNSLLAAICN